MGVGGLRGGGAWGVDISECSYYRWYILLVDVSVCGGGGVGGGYYLLLVDVNGDKNVA